MQTHSNSHKHKILRRVYGNIEIREELFREFIRRLCRSRHVKKVFLIGSRARGDHIPSSDFDIVVVTEGDDLIEVAEYISSLRKEPVSIDLLVLREEDLEDPIYREMLKDKKRLC